MAEHEEVRYEFKSVHTVRGTESLLRGKFEKAGWEFVDQSTATLRSTLNFRRPKPKTPWRLIAVSAGALLILVAIIGIGAAFEDDGDQGPDSSPSSSEASAKPKAKTSSRPESPATNITVDELLDKVNVLGLKTGDRFRVTGELFESDSWGTGASGDYSVQLKAKGGKDDLLVLVDESDADKWQDGTKVEMVLKVVTVTIDGEAMDGWLRAQTAKTISGGTTKAAKDAAAQDELFDQLSGYADSINSGSGTTVIDRIEPGYSDSSIHVQLNLGLASSTPLELKAVIQTMNGQIVEMAEGKVSSGPMVTYYLAGDEVAENRSIMDPTAVKFKGILDD